MRMEGLVFQYLEFEKDNPDSVTRKIEDKSIMTREGAKQMRAKQYGTNIRNKI